MKDKQRIEVIMAVMDVPKISLEVAGFFIIPRREMSVKMLRNFP
jgi:hypothetical protein